MKFNSHILSGLLFLQLAIGNWQSATATPVLFQLRQITGQYTVDQFTVTADARLNPQTDGTNLFGGFPQRQLRLTNGAAVVNLVPGGYTLTVPGWNRAPHFNVNAGTNVVNVATLITNLTSYYPVTFGGPPIAAGNNTSFRLDQGTNYVDVPAVWLPAIATDGSGYGLSPWGGDYSTFYFVNYPTRFAAGLIAQDDTGNAPTFMVYGAQPSNSAPALAVLTWDGNFTDAIWPGGGMSIGSTNVTLTDPGAGNLKVSGTISGNGAGLTNIPASGVVGLGSSFITNGQPGVVFGYLPVFTNSGGFNPQLNFVWQLNKISMSFQAGGVVFNNFSNSTPQGYADVMVGRLSADQIIFSYTNTPPTSTNLVKWISVQIAGDTNNYRLGLAK